MSDEGARLRQTPVLYIAGNRIYKPNSHSETHMSNARKTIAILSILQTQMPDVT